MKTRIISALVALAVFLPLVILGGWYFALAVWLLGLAALFEFANMQDLAFKNHIGVVSSIGLTSILLPSQYIPEFLSFVGSDNVFYITIVLLLTFTVFNHRFFNFTKASVIIFSAIYIGLGFNFLIQIRDMGIEMIIYLFLVIWSTDSGAYLIGSWLGKNLLAPAISPKKTKEGMVGGVFTALLVSSLYIWLFKPNLTEVDYIWVLTICLSLFGQFGDLVESAFKRHFKVKDSGTFLPGHGGVLDRFDSTIFASITLMIWINLFR